MATLVWVGDMVINLDAVKLMEYDQDGGDVRIYFDGPGADGRWPSPLVLQDEDAGHFWTHVVAEATVVEPPPHLQGR